jgi:hypothetical protein
MTCVAYFLLLEISKTNFVFVVVIVAPRCLFIDENVENCRSNEVLLARQNLAKTID